MCPSILYVERLYIFAFPSRRLVTVLKTGKQSGFLGLTLALAAIMVAAGCLGTGSGDSKAELTQTGSSTVLPLAIAWAEEFNGADVSVSGGGSSHGLNSLLNKETDLGDASRLMKGSDYEKVGGDPDDVDEDGTATKAAPTGVWPHKWIVAYDVLVVVDAVFG